MLLCMCPRQKRGRALVGGARHGCPAALAGCQAGPPPLPPATRVRLLWVTHRRCAASGSTGAGVKGPQRSPPPGVGRAGVWAAVVGQGTSRCPPPVQCAAHPRPQRTWWLSHAAWRSSAASGCSSCTGLKGLAKPNIPRAQQVEQSCKGRLQRGGRPAAARRPPGGWQRRAEPAALLAHLAARSGCPLPHPGPGRVSRRLPRLAEANTRLPCLLPAIRGSCISQNGSQSGEWLQATAGRPRGQDARSQGLPWRQAKWKHGRAPPSIERDKSQLRKVKRS